MSPLPRGPRGRAATSHVNGGPSASHARPAVRMPRQDSNPEPFAVRRAATTRQSSAAEHLPRRECIRWHESGRCPVLGCERAAGHDPATAPIRPLPAPDRKASRSLRRTGRCVGRSSAILGAAARSPREAHPASSSGEPARCSALSAPGRRCRTRRGGAATAFLDTDRGRRRADLAGRNRLRSHEVSVPGVPPTIRWSGRLSGIRVPLRDPTSSPPCARCQHGVPGSRIPRPLASRACPPQASFSAWG
jgi:hypothetical protein